MTSPAPIRLLIVDDHPVVRTGLVTMLQAHPTVAVVADVESGERALAVLPQSNIDVVLLDLRLPGMTGIETLKRLQSLRSTVKPIVFSTYERDEEVYQAIQEGARGYLGKDIEAKEMLEAIRRVYAGGTYYPKRIVQRLQNRRLRPELTKRELDVLKLVAQGLTNKEVAEAVHLSRFTVRNHLNSLMAKLEVSDRTEAAFVALQLGIISMD